MSHLFLTRWVSQLLGLALVSWAFARIRVHRASLRFSYLVFSIRSYWVSIVFLLYGRRIATHSVDPSLTHFLGEVPGLGLALVPNVVVTEAEQRCAWSRKLDSNFCPDRDRTSDPWHLAAAHVVTRLPRTPPFSRLLRHEGGWLQQDNSSPEPAGVLKWYLSIMHSNMHFCRQKID